MRSGLQEIFLSLCFFYNPQMRFPTFGMMGAGLHFRLPFCRKRAAALRSSGKYSAGSTRVLSAKYADAFRTALRRGAPIPVRTSGVAWGEDDMLFACRSLLVGPGRVAEPFVVVVQPPYELGFAFFPVGGVPPRGHQFVRLAVIDVVVGAPVEGDQQQGA